MFALPLLVFSLHQKVNMLKPSKWLIIPKHYKIEVFHLNRQRPIVYTLLIFINRKDGTNYILKQTL